MIYGTLIQTQTVTSGSPTSISFTSIPSTFTDVIAVCSVRSVSASNPVTMELQINGLGYSGYKMLYGSGSSVGVANGIESYIPGSTAYSGMFADSTYYFSNYASSDPKSIYIDNVSDNSTGTAYIRLIAGMWNDTNPITSLTFTTSSGFASDSIISLFGVTKGAGGATIS